jgi:transposase, IS5 family
MDQITLGLDPLPKKTRRELLLDEMNRVVPQSPELKPITPCKQMKDEV